jgi:hypothetical protein
MTTNRGFLLCYCFDLLLRTLWEAHQHRFAENPQLFVQILPWVWCELHHKSYIRCFQMTWLMNPFFKSTRAQINNKKWHRQWNQYSFLYTTPPFPHLQSTRRSNMVWMSSRRRAVIKFLLECALFDNKKPIWASQAFCYFIKSASATMGTRREDNGLNKILTIFYDNSDTAVHASTIEIADGWTHQLFLGLLLQEGCLSSSPCCSPASLHCLVEWSWWLIKISLAHDRLREQHPYSWNDQVLPRQQEFVFLCVHRYWHL